jgi:hypothetical protein
VHVDANEVAPTPMNGGGNDDDGETNETEEHQHYLGNGNVRRFKRVAQCFCSLENAFDLLVARTTKENNDNEHVGSNRANRNEYCVPIVSPWVTSNRQRWKAIAPAQNLRYLSTAGES